MKPTISLSVSLPITRDLMLAYTKDIMNKEGNPNENQGFGCFCF